MGIRQRLARWLDPEPEQRSLSSWDLLRAGSIGIAPAAGQFVSPASAEHALTGVTACVNAISGAIASLPAWVHRGDQIVEDHPVARMIRAGPNRHQSWADWLEFTVAGALLRGNAISEVVTDGAGRAIELRPAPWSTVSIVQLPGDRIAFDVTHPRTSTTRRLLEGEVFHLRDRADHDETFGISRLQRAAGVVGHSQALAEFSGSVWRNGAFPSGAIELESRLGQDDHLALATNLNEVIRGPRNAARILILDQAMKWRSIQISPEDAELLESRKFSVVEICRLYGVPPPIIQDYEHNTFTNAETAGRWFAIFTLTPWIRKLEDAFARSVFTEGEQSLRIEFDLSGLLRGDPELRWKSHEIAARAGILTIDEIREAENYPPMPEGDRPTVTAA
ncbi:MAG: phage portal protein [Geminicoccaceae bacterium]